MNFLQAIYRGFSNLLASVLLALLSVFMCFAVLFAPYHDKDNLYNGIRGVIIVWLLLTFLTGYLSFAFHTRANSNASKASFCLNMLSFVLLVGAAIYFSIYAF